MGAEADIEDYACMRATAAGIFNRKVQWPGRRGAPDRLFSSFELGVLFMEFKAPGKLPEPHQIREHQRMRAAGLTVYVVDSKEEALRILGLS